MQIKRHFQTWHATRANTAQFGVENGENPAFCTLTAQQHATISLLLSAANAKNGPTRQQNSVFHHDITTGRIVSEQDVASLLGQQSKWSNNKLV